jgi:hypothetical protein
MAVAWVFIALIGFAAFNMWLRQQRRLIVHRERMAALEKGIELPAPAPDGQQSSWNVQRILLLAGLCWIAVGLATFAILSELIANAPPLPPPEVQIDRSRIPDVSYIPKGLHVLGLLPMGLGVAHLIVYFVEKRKLPEA